MLGNYHPEPVLATLTQGLAGRENYDISTSRLTAARSASELPTHFNKFFNPLLVKEGLIFKSHSPLSCWSRLVGRVGVDPTMSLDVSFTDCCGCRFATYPYKYRLLFHYQLLTRSSYPSLCGAPDGSRTRIIFAWRANAMPIRRLVHWRSRHDSNVHYLHR